MRKTTINSYLSLNGTKIKLNLIRMNLCLLIEKNKILKESSEYLNTKLYDVNNYLKNIKNDYIISKKELSRVYETLIYTII